MSKQNGAHRIFHKFIVIVQNVVNITSSSKNKALKTKKEHKIAYKNCIVSLMKSIVYSMNEKNPHEELFNIYKIKRNYVIRKLRKASNDYQKTISIISFSQNIESL